MACCYTRSSLLNMPDRSSAQVLEKSHNKYTNYTATANNYRKVAKWYIKQTPCHLWMTDENTRDKNCYGQDASLPSMVPLPVICFLQNSYTMDSTTFFMNHLSYFHLVFIWTGTNNCSLQYKMVTYTERKHCKRQGLLGCDAVWNSRWLPTFLGNILPSPSGYKCSTPMPVQSSYSLPQEAQILYISTSICL